LEAAPSKVEFEHSFFTAIPLTCRHQGLEFPSPACARSKISGWRDRALYPLAARRRAARRILVAGAGRRLGAGRFLFGKLVAAAVAAAV